MERRRRQAAAWDGTIECRHCLAPVALRKDRIERGGDGRMWIRCTSCSGAFAVRVSDPSLDVAQAASVVAERPVPPRRTLRSRLLPGGSK